MQWVPFSWLWNFRCAEVLVCERCQVFCLSDSWISFSLFFRRRNHLVVAYPNFVSSRNDAAHRLNVSNCLQMAIFGIWSFRKTWKNLFWDEKNALGQLPTYLQVSVLKSLVLGSVAILPFRKIIQKSRIMNLSWMNGWKVEVAPWKSASKVLSRSKFLFVNRRKCL